MKQRKHQNRYYMLGSLIAFYRKRKHLTQEKLAEVVGRDSNTISKIEQGATAPSLDTFFDIADALGIPPYKLLKFFDEDE